MDGRVALRLVKVPLKNNPRSEVMGTGKSREIGRNG